MEKSGVYSSGSSKVKDSWERENSLKNYPYGYPWPPRYYTCSFCQREFRSAQALGGHMNIHRRDRARLRDLSPNNSNNNSDQINPNPNPSTSIISSSTNNQPYSSSLVSLSLSSIPRPPLENRTTYVVSSNSKEVVRLDLELCVGQPKEDLDLELRLGI